MAKVDVVLIILNREFLAKTVKQLNLDNANLTTIILDKEAKEKTFAVGDKQVPLTSFSTIQGLFGKYKASIWLIGGYVKELYELQKMRQLLMAGGVPENNIVNFEVSTQISATWLANLRHVEEHAADFFATGNEYMRDALNLKYIPRVWVDKEKVRGGVCLADDNQDLRQGYLTAKYIFEHVAPGTIKFVLIGLTPYSFRYDNARDFPNRPKNLQYLLALNSEAENVHDRHLKNLLGDEVKNIFASTSAEQADLNFDSIKAKYNHEFSTKAMADWRKDTRFLTSEVIKANVQILKDYIKLCLDNGAKPVGVVYPLAPVARKNYDRELLTRFREIIWHLEVSSDFMCVEMSELNLNYDCFGDITHLNGRGASFANSFLSMKLLQVNLIPAESFCDMTYEYFHKLSWIAPKDEYNSLMAQVFKASAQMLSRKDKIKVGFVTIDSAQWCGDDLYNLFADNDRFEVTIFDCLRLDKINNEMIVKDFQRGVEQFKEKGLNIIALDKRNAVVPAQDVLIFLTPYFGYLPLNFRPENITAKTLMTHIIYSLAVSVRANSYYNLSIFRTAQKIFFPSIVNLKMYDEKLSKGMPRGLYSGYPKLDVFYRNPTAFKFDWKMARSDAKKIIWAPHWSINDVTKWATFQWNYKFMYEFAKGHPEISWIVKPHQALFFSAVKEKIFPSHQAFEEYLQAWDDLPNAQVYTGAYYQAIFATSDGMIHDSGSFTAEYQYVNKPMIYLTREGTVFNELGNEIFKGSYLVDGKDFEKIAETIQKVIIEGKDDKAAARREVFDKYLNYPKANGMTASEFIYKSIADELKGESE